MIKFRFGHIKTNVWKKMIYIWFINHKLLKRIKSLIMIQVPQNCNTIQLFRGGGMGIIFRGNDKKNKKPCLMMSNFHQKFFNYSLLKNQLGFYLVNLGT